jgi:hypothetical protein
MENQEEWAFPPEFQPDADATRFDLERALSAVVALDADDPGRRVHRAHPRDRPHGQRVVIREDGLALTIGYLVTEAADVKLTTRDGRVVDAHPIAIDFASGLGLVQPLGELGVAPLPRGSAGRAVAGRHGERDLARRASPRALRAPGGEARVRRLLGVPARRGAVHRPAASGVERRRARRRARAASSASARCSCSR